MNLVEIPERQVRGKTEHKRNFEGQGEGEDMFNQFADPGMQFEANLVDDQLGMGKKKKKKKKKKKIEDEYDNNELEE